MNILYALNENYMPHLAASACSLCENNKGVDQINFHIISLGIKPESQSKFIELCQRYNRSVQFYELGDMRKRLKGDYDTHGFDISILTRLFVGSVLPESVDKILYLDCDTIVLDNLQDCWNTDLADNVLAAVPEPVITKSRRGILNMDETDNYYNSGVLLFNLSLWREQNCEEKILKYFVQNSSRLIAGDQDAINACFKGQIVALLPKYNFASYNLYYPYKLLKKLAGKSPYITEDQYNDSKKNPVIIHYLGEERPWRIGNTHPNSDDYKKYLSLTPWSDFQFETGWELYFFCFRIFNTFTKPLPQLRYKIIDSLIPAFMKFRAKQLKKAKNNK